MIKNKENKIPTSLEHILIVMEGLKNNNLWDKNIVVDKISKSEDAYNLLLDNRYCPTCFPYTK